MVAIIALLLCWVPIVNNFVFFLGLVGVVLGAIAWFGTRGGRAGGRTMSIAAVVISAISMVGVVATQALYVDVLDDIGRSMSDAADGETEMSDTEQEAADTEAQPVGGTAEIGEYAVVINDVRLDADNIVQQANSFNDAPTGQYVLVSLEVTYNGDEEGDPWLDLSVELAGSDARNYSQTTCSAVPPNPAMDVPTLRTGGQANFDVCFDVPKEALKDPKIFVEESFSFRNTRAYWETQQ